MSSVRISLDLEMEQLDPNGDSQELTTETDLDLFATLTLLTAEETLRTAGGGQIIAGQLNIRSEITRVRGLAGNSPQRQQQQTALAGPVDRQQILANALSKIQDSYDTLSAATRALCEGNIALKEWDRLSPSVKRSRVSNALKNAGLSRA